MGNLEIFLFLLDKIYLGTIIPITERVSQRHTATREEPVSHLINMTEGAYLAMHGLAKIAQKQPERLTVKHLAQELDASQAHLAKVFQKLSKAGLVTSVRGPSGGFVLNKEADRINFLEIYEIMEGKVQLNACPLGKAKCAFDKCIFSSEFHRISHDLYETYKRISLADFAD